MVCHLRHRICFSVCERGKITCASQMIFVFAFCKAMEYFTTCVGEPSMRQEFASYIFYVSTSVIVPIRMFRYHYFVCGPVVSQGSSQPRRARASNKLRFHNFVRKCGSTRHKAADVCSGSKHFFRTFHFGFCCLVAVGCVTAFSRLCRQTQPRVAITEM